ncbi:hypothetical protein F441_22333 [Phytophthora nicotianae CJ01A1]|uniref:Uncharacterized protein n=1 Tax=Phytophthora nicotianae CJ01A1 TaxID=1317063 RepID=W2VPI4_PHYNI|nr:hypothetical protein F441_22333 [Phytophthora nicotianae CJ01A1]
MAVNTANMLALHFHRRLHQYVRFRYAKEGKIQLSFNKTKKLVNNRYRVQEVQEFDTNGNQTATTKMWGAWDKWRTSEKRVRHEFVDEGFYFVTKVYDMNSWMKGFVEKHPRQEELISTRYYHNRALSYHLTLH